MVSGHRQAIDSAPVKANASMDSLLLKQPAQSQQIHISKEDNQMQGEVTKHKGLKPEQFISAAQHQLKKVEKHQENLKQSPGALSGKGEIKFSCDCASPA